MGAIFSSASIVSSVQDFVTGKKRKRNSYEDDEVTNAIDVILHTPKKVKLLSTPQYIYRTLYENSQDFDITVFALGEEFKLHKLYLCQSPYFASMFGGSWKEASETCVTINVCDPLITVDSLRTVFGSLYNNELELNPADVIAILATATMFQLDELIDKCSEIMFKTTNPKTCLEYYTTAYQYGNKSVQKACFKWFLVNLMTYYYPYPLKGLQSIPVWLMKKLVKHSDLIVLQTEFSIYVMLKLWMYMKIHHSSDTDINAPTNKEINAYFSSRADEPPFLLTEMGREFRDAFANLRLQHLVSHPTDIELLTKDNIIPAAWLNPIVMAHWNNVLRVNQNDDTGPEQVTPNVFLNSCLRCARNLQDDERHVWRWTGFHFGVDLNMIADGNTISIKRNHRSEGEQLLSFQAIRKLTIRIAVMQLNEQRQVIYSKQTEMETVNLTKNEEIEILKFEKNISYPLIISANILYVLPSVNETL